MVRRLSRFRSIIFSFNTPRIPWSEPYIALISGCRSASWMAPQMLLLMTAVGPPDCAKMAFPCAPIFPSLGFFIRKSTASSVETPACTTRFTASAAAVRRMISGLLTQTSVMALKIEPGKTASDHRDNRLLHSLPYIPSFSPTFRPSSTDRRPFIYDLHRQERFASFTFPLITQPSGNFGGRRNDLLLHNLLDKLYGHLEDGA